PLTVSNDRTTEQHTGPLLALLAEGKLQCADLGMQLNLVLHQLLVGHNRPPTLVQTKARRGDYQQSTETGNGEELDADAAEDEIEHGDVQPTRMSPIRYNG